MMLVIDQGGLEQCLRELITVRLSPLIIKLLTELNTSLPAILVVMRMKNEMSFFGVLECYVLLLVLFIT